MGTMGKMLMILLCCMTALPLSEAMASPKKIAPTKSIKLEYKGKYYLADGLTVSCKDARAKKTIWKKKLTGTRIYRMKLSAKKKKFLLVATDQYTYLFDLNTGKQESKLKIDT